MDKYVLQTNSLSKSFGRTEILHGIDMSIEYGEIYGLIGQNGAGKTTLLRLISGLMKPTKGTVNLQTGKPFIGYMPQSCRFDDNTTVSEIIRFFARLRNADTKESVFLVLKYVVLIFFTILCLYPLLWLFLSSFKSNSEILLSLQYRQ